MFVYLAALGAWGQSWVLPYFDYIGIRDAGTVLSYYASQPAPLKALFEQAMFHIEGPLQFVVLNAYCYTVGNILPLNALTMQLPNTLITFAAVVIAYLLGKQLVSPRFGYLVALAFALCPWLAESVRAPWYFNTISCLLHFAVFYFWYLILSDPGRTGPKIAASVSLALYLLIGMDWPSFLFSLGAFLLLSGRFRIAIWHPYNLIPLSIVLLQILWPITLHFTGRGHMVTNTMLLYPFFRYTDLATNPDFVERVVTRVLAGWGPLVVLALIGLVAYVTRFRRGLREDRTSRSLFDSMCIWFVGAGYALVMSATSATYLYVVAIPTALLAAWGMYRARNSYVGLMVGALAAFQIYFITADNFTIQIKDNRRVLAAAAFLIEQRPDLLVRDKIAFLPRNDAANVGQYARGQNQRIVMPQAFPVELRKHSVGSDEPTLLAFVKSYTTHKKILADWIILDSELFSPDVEARDFYINLRDDPQVRWIARFEDKTGGALILGEVTKDNGSPFSQAPLMDSDYLAAMYERKYDRIGFLKHNVQYVDHY